MALFIRSSATMPKQDDTLSSICARVLSVQMVKRLAFSRASLIVLAFCFICVMISGNNLFVRHTKTILYLIPLLFIIITYAFGILGNIRCGCAWNACTVINEIGQYNARYPAWLPDEFKWAYTYITSPLFRLASGDVI